MRLTALLSAPHWRAPYHDGDDCIRKERYNKLLDKGGLLEKFALTRGTVTNCGAELLQYSNGISDPCGYGIDMLCLFKINIRSCPDDCGRRVRMGAHACRQCVMTMIAPTKNKKYGWLFLSILVAFVVCCHLNHCASIQIYLNV
jgi:hypothetical protein